MPAKLSRMEARKLGISVPAGAMSSVPHLPDMERRFKLKPEERLSIECADLLRARAREDVLWMHIPNEAQRSKASWAMQMAMGFCPGAADFLILQALRIGGEWNRPLWVELKCGKNTLSPDQLAFQQRATEHGMPYYVCRSLEGFTNRLDQHGILR